MEQHRYVYAVIEVIEPTRVDRFMSTNNQPEIPPPLPLFQWIVGDSSWKVLPTRAINNELMGPAKIARLTLAGYILKKRVGVGFYKFFAFSQACMFNNCFAKKLGQFRSKMTLFTIVLLFDLVAANAGRYGKSFELICGQRRVVNNQLIL